MAAGRQGAADPHLSHVGEAAAGEGGAGGPQETEAGRGTGEGGRLVFMSI